MSEFTLSSENEVGVMGDVGGYDWHEVHVYYWDHAYWLSEQSGCSCNSYEDPRPADTQRFSTKAELLAYVAGLSAYAFTPDEKAALRKAVDEYQPQA